MLREWRSFSVSTVNLEDELLHSVCGYRGKWFILKAKKYHSTPSCGGTQMSCFQFSTIVCCRYLITWTFWQCQPYFTITSKAVWSELDYITTQTLGHFHEKLMKAAITELFFENASSLAVNLILLVHWFLWQDTWWGISSSDTYLQHACSGPVTETYQKQT